MKNKTILYVDDDAENLSTLSRVLRGKFEVLTAQSGTEALARLERDPCVVLVADQRMPKMTGVEFLKAALKKDPNRVGILLTAYADMEALVEGVNTGVIYRYLTKPYQEGDLVQAINQAFEKNELVSENKRLVEELKRANAHLRKEINDQFDFSLVTGSDAGMKPVENLISKVAPTQSTVLIRGESGVGKELVARAIHMASPRKDKPFLKVNCAALAEGILESELFGHEKGAFSGAVAERIGKFEAANGGTLFLDEIGDISPKVQVSLLRLIQERTLERVGGNKTITVDVRILAATHRNLEEMSKKGTFREDLYFRLNVFPIVVPPLRDRMGDLPSLTKRLLVKAAHRTGLAPKDVDGGALEKLKSYDWPGNVRELENVLERALILSSNPQVTSEDLALGTGLDEVITPPPETKELTRETLEAAIQAAKGNKLEAARNLGIKRPTLYYHLKRLGIG